MTQAPDGLEKAAETNSPFVESTEADSAPATPAKDAKKDDWVAAADARGLDTGGTVNELKERIAAHDAADDEANPEPAPVNPDPDAGAAPANDPEAVEAPKTTEAVKLDEDADEERDEDADEDPLGALPAEKLPLSATSGDLQATVLSRNGLVLLEVSLVGWIGDAPVTILASHAKDFDAVLKALRKQAKSA